MSQKVFELNYAVNEGDSPVNLSHVSEGSTASPVRISPVQKSNQISSINYLSNLKHSLNQYNSGGRNEQQQLQYQHSHPIQESENDQYEYNNDGNHNDTNISYSQSGTRSKQGTLGVLMKGLSPKEFAAMQVYGQNQRQNKGNTMGTLGTYQTVKSIGSVNNNNMQQGPAVEHIETLDNQNSQGEIIVDQDHYQHDYQQLVSPSKYTQRSQALFEYLAKTGEIAKNQDRLPNSAYTKNLLLSDENMNQFEKENKKKPHQRIQSQKEMELINRLYSDHEEKLKKNSELKRDYEEKMLKECTFSPRLMRSHFNSGSNFNFGNTHSQESQYYSKREPNFYEQSQKMKTLYESHKEILKDAKENEEKQQVLDKPKLTKKTQQISEQAFQKKGQKSLSVIDRLFQEKKVPQQPEDPNPYKPTISNYKTKNRKVQKIDEYLYQDAKRRREEDKQSKSVTHSNQKTINFNSISTHGPTQGSTYNPNTHKRSLQKAIASKFDKEFQQAVADMAFTKDPNRKSMPETISYLEAIEILQNLNFINQKSFEENQIIATQVQRVWNQLSGRQNKSRVLVRNLEVFLFAVQNIRADSEMIPYVTEEQLQQEGQNTLHHKSQHLNPDDSSPRSHFNSQQQSQNQDNMEMINQKIAERAEMINSKLSESKRSAVGFFDKNDNLYYIDEQVNQIHKQFKDIYDNRLTAEKGARRASKNNEISHPYAPEISETSRRLAQERRERVVDDLKNNPGFVGALDINEILSYQQQLTKFQNQELKQKLEEEKMNECTFHPQTKDFSKVQKYFSPRNNNNGTNFEEEMQGKVPSERKQATSTKPLGVHRTLELYSLAKPQNQRRDRDKGDIEYEKECDECTFSPDISHIKLTNFNSTINGSQYNSYQSPNKSKQLTNLQQKGIQKSIDRMKTGRLNTKVNEQIQNQGITVSNKQRQSIEKFVNISLQSEKHTHERPQGRFISTNSHHNHSNSGQNRVISSSPKPNMFSPQETQEYSHQNNMDPQEHVDTARSGKSQPNQGDSQDVTEYFLKQPQQQPSQEKEKSLPITSKTMEEDRVPLLFVDVNIEDGKTARIIVYEGEKSEDLANKFAQEHNLDSVMTGRLKDLLDQQINSLLTKIDEEVGSDREEEEEESGEDEQGNYIHRRRHKKQKMIDHHINEEDQQQTSHQIVEETPQNNLNIIYTEENFDYMSSQNRLNNPNLHNQVSTSDQNIKSNQTIPHPDEHKEEIHLQDDEEEHNKVKRAAGGKEHEQENDQQPKQSAQDIMEMHMKALAQTFKNYSESEEKQKQLPNEDNNSKLTSSQQQKKLTQKEIEEMHMKALATTYKNYSENEDKQSQLPVNEQKVTLQDMENLHMKALAATFQNYSNDPNKLNQLPNADFSNSSSKKVFEYEQHSPLNNGQTQAGIYSYQNQPQVSNNSYTGSLYKPETSIVSNSYTASNSNTNQLNVQDIMNNHMKALTSTYQNYSENPDKFNYNQTSQPSSSQYLPSSTNYGQATSASGYNQYSTTVVQSNIPNTYTSPVTQVNYSTSTYNPLKSSGTQSSTTYNAYTLPTTNTYTTTNTYGTTGLGTYGGSTTNTYGLPSSNTYGTTSSNNYGLSNNNTYGTTNNTYGVTTTYGTTSTSNPYSASTTYTTPSTFNYNPTTYKY